MVKIKKRGRMAHKNDSVSTEASKKVGFCLHPACRKRFFAKRGGKKKQRFCKQDHKKEFEALIYRMGRSVLKRCLKELREWSKQREMGHRC